MTAYGRAESSLEPGHVTVELTSLNRRHLEISCSLPRSLNHLEIGLRKMVGKMMARGQVTLSVFLQQKETTPVHLVPHASLIKELMQGWKQISEMTGLPLSLELLKNSGYPLFVEESERQTISLDELAGVVELAVNQAILMKEKEGEALRADLLAHVARLRSLMGEIEKEAPTATEKYRTKLKERMAALFGEVDERILKEIALLAEKMDISEEIVRFKSHLSQFSALLETPLEALRESKGKTLDFLTQELMREINTLGAKSSSTWVIESKGEIEKMREQVQNVE